MRFRDALGHTAHAEDVNCHPEPVEVVGLTTYAEALCLPAWLRDVTSPFKLKHSNEDWLREAAAPLGDVRPSDRHRFKASMHEEVGAPGVANAADAMSSAGTASSSRPVGARGSGPDPAQRVRMRDPTTADAADGYGDGGADGGEAAPPRRMRAKARERRQHMVAWDRCALHVRTLAPAAIWGAATPPPPVHRDTASTHCTSLPLWAPRRRP